MSGLYRGGLLQGFCPTAAPTKVLGLGFRGLGFRAFRISYVPNVGPQILSLETSKV